MAGTDIIHASNDTLTIYTASELIAVDQDLGLDGKIQGRKIGKISVIIETKTTYGVIVAACDGSTAQQWKISTNGKIVHTATGRILDVLDCKPAPAQGGGSLGMVIGNDPLCEGRNQHFTVNSGNHTITSAVDGSCLDVHGGTIGEAVEIHWCTGNTNEQWQVNGSAIIPYKPKGSCLTITEGGKGSGEIWMKVLKDGSRAVLLLNLGESHGKMTVNFTTIGMPSDAKAKVRDLWAQKDMGVFTGAYTTEVEGHGVVVVKIVDV